MKKILIVENDKSIVEQIRKALYHENFDIIEASNGWEGLEFAIDEIPDLIISNAELPQLTGIQLFKEIKKYPIINKIPFYLISTYKLNDDLHSVLFESRIFKFDEPSIADFTKYINEKINDSLRKTA
jgi:CheY-like chemotaxis protein